jgi:hypothetical protein
MFAGIAPASAAPTPAILINPVVGTSYVTPIDEDFTLAITRNPESALSAADYALLKYQIVQSTTWSMNVRADQSGGATASAVVQASISSVIADTFFYNGLQDDHGGLTVSNTVKTQSFVVVPDAVQAGQTQKLSIALGNEGDRILTSSPAVTVTVTAFIDYNGDNKYDSRDTIASVQAITFTPYASLGVTVAMPSVEAGQTSVRPTATVSGWNHEQFDGSYAFEVNQHLPDGIVTKVGGTAGYEAVAERTFTWSAPATFARDIPIRSASASYTVSAGLVFLKAVDGAAGITTIASSSNVVVALSDLATSTVAAAGATAMSLHAVTGDNAIVGGTADGYDVRANSTFTVRITVSGAISASDPVATVTFSNTAVSALKNYSVNGGASVVSGTASAISVAINRVTGVGTFTLATSGFAPGDFISMSAKISGLAAAEIAVQPVDLIWTVTAASDYLSTAPNTAFSAAVTVKDQFDVKSSIVGTQRIKFGWTSGYGGTATNSFVVVTDGAASATLTPSRTPVTGSAEVTYTLQNYSASTGNWTDTAYTDTSTVYVTSDANGFRTGLAASYSASISYGADFSWSAAINAASTIVTGSQVVVSGTGLIFKDSAGATASDTITLPASSNGVATFYVTARLAGTFPITLTAGSATTTSEIVVLPARSDAGASINWDTTTITAGKTKIVTGTLVDLNGNPVDTTAAGTAAGDSGTASLTVTYVGSAGIPVGSMPTETNADGKFQISVLTSAADSGTFTVTAVYRSAGSATATADIVTSVQAITVGAGDATASASDDQKVNAGSFKGYVAVYAKGYQGQRMSAKIGNDWVVVESLASNFERVVDFTGAGYTIAVRIYIDRVLVDTITVTTK